MPIDELREGPSLGQTLKWMRATLIIVCILALGGFLLTLIVEQGFQSRATKVQIVRIDPTQHNPLGPVTAEVGEPTLLIVADSNAIMKGTTPSGLPKVDVEYLRLHPSAATTLPPILRQIGIARIGCLIAIVATLFGAIWLPRIKFFADLNEI